MAEADGTEPTGSGTSTVVVIIVSVIGGVVVLGGILASLAIYGVRRYIGEAKAAEGRSEVAVLARGIADCASSSGRLPASSRAVPASLAAVSGKKYASAPSEWSSDPAFACAHFVISSPQYFQYQWLLDASGSGRAVATADLDGDGSPDVLFGVSLSCVGRACRIGALEEKR